MKKLIFIYIPIVLVVINCNDINNNLIIVDKTIKFDSTFVKSYRYTNNEIKIDSLGNSTNYFIHDTLFVSVENPIGYPVGLVIKFSDKKFESYVEMWSDYPQYSGEPIKMIKIKPEFLILNKIEFEQNDTLFGDIKTKITYINDKDFPFDSIMFEGKFISIIR